MSEIHRTPEKLSLQGICKIPAGKAGKAAAKQYSNERKARKRALARLAAADSKAGIGLLVLLKSEDRRLGRYIFKKLDKVIPFYVRALTDGASGMPAEEMSRLMDACERRGYRTLWLDLAGTEKIDKKAVLHLVAGELMRVLEKPAPEKAPAEDEVEPETMVEESIEPETAEPQEESELESKGAEESINDLEEQIERVEVELEIEEPVEDTDVGIIQEETSEKVEMVSDEPAFSADIGAEDSENVIAEPKSEDVKQVAESPVTAEEIPAIEENSIAEEKPAAEVISVVEEKSEPEEKPAEEIISIVEEKPVSEEKPAAKEEPEPDEKQAPEEKPVPRRRSRKAPAKTEDEKAPTKPRRKRAPAAPLTVEATLAKRRRQMGLE